MNDPKDPPDDTRDENLENALSAAPGLRALRERAQARRRSEKTTQEVPKATVDALRALSNYLGYDIVPAAKLRDAAVGVRASDTRSVVCEFLHKQVTPDVFPCGDNSCSFGKPGGMATNGGCRCFSEPDWVPGGHLPPQIRVKFYSLAHTIRDLAAEIARLRVELESKSK